MIILCIYLPYIIPYIPVFYFNDLQISTVHVHALYASYDAAIRYQERRATETQEQRAAKLRTVFVLI